MSKLLGVFSLVLLMVVFFTACGGASPEPKSEAVAVESTQAETAGSKSTQIAARTGFAKIADISEAWSELYNQNEAILNAYEGMPIMGLVTPPMTFVAGVQYDMLNLDNLDGRFEGKLMLAGFPGFVEKKGTLIRFGYENTLEKDGFAPNDKAGDRTVQSGFFDLNAEYYQAEKSTVRGDRTISRSFTEFKRLQDGSMICIDFNGRAIDGRGNDTSADEVIFLHNGKGRYDFVIAKAQNGPGFEPISFADQGELAKDQAIKLLIEAGYTLDKVGGIQDGQLVLDKINE